MRKLAIILVLALTCLWGYTSWYWYTCKIKGICTLERINPDTIGNTRQVSSTTKQGILEAQEKKSEILNTAENASSKKDIIPKEKPSTEQQIPEEKEVVKEECEDIITSAIGIGSNNKKSQVENLEKFLNEVQSGSLVVNGIYEQEDFEAVKQFQLTYKEEILDPWNIEEPTGYVFKTTIQKINEIHCDN